MKPDHVFAKFSLLFLSWVLFLNIPAQAALSLDAKVSKDQSTATITSPAFSTSSGNELLLALISTDYLSGPNTTVTNVTGGGLSWVLVRRSNVQSGSSEIWRAFAPSALGSTTVTATLSQSVYTSITIVSFAGADPSGTNGSGAIGATAISNSTGGAPKASLTTTRNGSWVLGVGNDFDNAINRTIGPNQSLIHQYLTPTGDTYWSQMESAATAASGTTVTINDTAPSADRYNLNICEVLPASAGGQQTWGLSGTISPSIAGAGTAVSLSGAATLNTTADSSGNYSFTGLANGIYTVTPTKSGYTFAPASQTISISDANSGSVNFVAQANPPPGSALGIDVTSATDSPVSSKTISTATFSTHSPNELLLAFVQTDYLSGSNTTVTSVSGGGLTWALVKRTNVQSGGSEIWRAFAPAQMNNMFVTANLSQSILSSLTVMSFSGVDSSGTNGSGAIGAVGTANSSHGAPSASLTTTRAGSWIVGDGNDYDNAVGRTVGPAQHLIHQTFTATGDTYWVQIQNGPTPNAGTSVTINDTAPVNDRYNLSICEVLSGSGSATPPTPPTVALTAPAPGTVANLLTLWAVASDADGIGGVQFLLDGTALGTEVTTAPYTFLWDTRTTTAGSHALTARARNPSGLTTTTAPITVTVDNSGSSAVVGSWSSVVNIPAVAVNLILLKNNKVLFYEDGSTPTVWDYINGTFTNVPTVADLFCSGHALLPDGRVLIAGGFGGAGNAIGIANAEIFDPADNSWTALPNMSYRRWYPNATTLADGRILVTAGWQTTAHTNAGIPEIYSPSTNAWTKLTAANNPFESYPFIYQLSDGRVIHVGNSEYATVTDILDLNTQTWSVVDPNIVDGASAAMYLPDKVMKAGSAADSQDTGGSARTTYVLDVTQTTPVWQQVPSMAYTRSFMNLVTLPDGNVLAVGGESDKNGGNIANAVYAAELWSPQSRTWTTMASMHTPREYHGTALLLPDARVLVSGMGADFGNVPNEMNAEFYSPPYLSKGPRPTISQDPPATVSFGSNFFVGTPDAANITRAVLIRTGAVTHFFDENTRYVPVNFQLTTGGLTISAPVSANFAPPGYYMLFLLNANGVPSVAPFLRLQ